MGSLPFGWTSTIEPRPGFCPSASQASAPSVIRWSWLTACIKRIAGDETGEAEEQRRGLAVGDQKPLGVEDFLLRIDALREQEVRIVRQLAAIGVVIGVIGPQDVERAGIALIDEPAEVVEMMDEPKA